ncbi:ALT4 [Scenedesmus sp. PABB004]|nr:ALT4 [Scenedesmus sp. PABB004]
MEVRDYELDQFSVVNNAVYASYVQHGRHKALASLGLHVEGFQEAGTLMALSQLHLSFRQPLRAGDTFLVTTAVSAVSAARIVIDHTCQRVTGHSDGGDAPQVVCQGQATVVFLDARYRPVRVPAGVRDTLAPLAAEYASGGGA